MQIICDEKKCTGCGACSNVCPKEAVSMQKNAYGFITPVIDESACVNCGLCTQICPTNSDGDRETNRYRRSYAMYCKDATIARQSSSGGIFYSISRLVVEELNGIVFGAVLDESKQVKIVSAEHMEGVRKMMGSKYVYSDTGYTYREVRIYLESGKYVLYSGLPCQIAGLKAYLRKNYQNLLTLEILCHGAPSQELFDKYVEEAGRRHGAAVKKVIQRDEHVDWNPLIPKKVAIEFEDGHMIRRKEDYDMYMSLFIRELSYNTVCYCCPYAGPDRMADITLGDYGGLGVYKKFRHRNKAGVSFVRTNSQKGYNVINKISGLYMEQRPDEEIGIMNSAIVRPVKMPEKRAKFMEDYKHMEGHALFEKYFYKDYKYWVRCIAKNTIICLLGPGVVARMICGRRDEMKYPGRNNNKPDGMDSYE